MINRYIYKSLYKFISTGMLIRHKLLNSPKGLGKGALIHDIYMSHETVPGLQGLGTPHPYRNMIGVQIDYSAVMVVGGRSTTK